MRRMLLAFALPLTVFTSVASLSTRASADVMPDSKCKCSTIGTTAEGGLVATALGGAGLLLLTGRRRRR
jgi:MYXO-CTERM domain-containing protein